MKTILAAMTALLLSTTAATAATSFNFSGNGGLASSYSFTEDGITVDVTPAVFSNGNTPTITDQGWVGQYNGGLGITNSIFDGDHQVDGFGNNDLAIFKFSENVTLQSVTFSFVGPNDDFAFFFDNGPDGDLDLINDDVDIPGLGVGTYVFNSTWTGMLFGIGAKGGNDEFKIKGMMVERVSVIPLPAALPLYGAGLAVLGLIGWIRRKRG